MISALPSLRVSGLHRLHLLTCNAPAHEHNPRIVDYLRTSYLLGLDKLVAMCRIP
jgi:hypothetical protein